jgi:hydrogenase maturation protein HypF
MQIIQKLGLCEEKEAKVQLAMLERKINAVESTSAGRLFDGISAILGIRKKSSFEGEASMALEFAAEAYEKRSGEKKINVLDGQKCLIESSDVSAHENHLQLIRLPSDEAVIHSEIHRP